MASWSATNLKQEILSNSWLVVIVNGIWKANTHATRNLSNSRAGVANKLETGNTEELLVNSDRWKQAEEQ
jgi:hypothetical protein